eukprot:7880_1
MSLNAGGCGTCACLCRHPAGPAKSDSLSSVDDHHAATLKRASTHGQMHSFPTSRKRAKTKRRTAKRILQGKLVRKTSTASHNRSKSISSSPWQSGQSLSSYDFDRAVGRIGGGGECLRSMPAGSGQLRGDHCYASGTYPCVYSCACQCVDTCQCKSVWSSVASVGVVEDPCFQHRKAMEDRTLFLDRLESNPEAGLFGVFDGHSSYLVADFVKCVMGPNFDKSVRKLQEAQKASASNEHLSISQSVSGTLKDPSPDSPDPSPNKISGDPSENAQNSTDSDNNPPSEVVSPTTKPDQLSDTETSLKSEIITGPSDRTTNDMSDKSMSSGVQPADLPQKNTDSGSRISDVSPVLTDQQTLANTKDQFETTKDQSDTFKDQTNEAKSSTPKDEPAVILDQSATPKDQLVASKDQSATPNNRLLTAMSSKGKPHTTQDKLTTSKGQLSTTKDQSTTTPKDKLPKTEDQTSTSSNSHPPTAKDQASLTNAQPIPSKDQSATTNDLPATTKDQPATTQDQSATINGKPATGKDQPATTKDQASTRKGKSPTTKDKTVAITVSPDTSSIPAQAIRSAFHRTSSQLIGLGEDSEFAGAAACAVLVWPDLGDRSSGPAKCRLLCANVGDTRATLCRGGVAYRLSVDHSTLDQGEAERVWKVGGEIKNGRLMGLNVTRSMGDRAAETLGMSHEPHVSETILQPEDEFVIIASDGVWDKVTDSEAVSLVRSIRSPTIMAQHLASTAIQKGSRDNTSVMVLRFWGSDSDNKRMRRRVRTV